MTVSNTQQKMSTKKIRKPNKFKEQKNSVNIRISRGEKKEALIDFRKRSIQESNHKKLKVTIINEDDRKLEELVQSRKLKLEELLSIKTKEQKCRSRKPAKHKAEPLGKVKITDKKPKRAPKNIAILSERRTARLLEKQREAEAMRIIDALNNKKITEAKKAQKKERVEQARLKSATISKNEEKRKTKFEDTEKKPANALARKSWRSLMNGRKNGHKNRQKNRIVEVREASKVPFGQYITKKGQEKNRYVRISNPAIRKVVVIDRTNDIKAFEKKEEDK